MKSPIDVQFINDFNPIHVVFRKNDIPPKISF